MSTKANDLRIVRFTCPDPETARRIALTVVERRLAACANLLPGVTAIYRWGGEICEDGEVLVELKTREEFVESLFTSIVALHPYQMPAIEVLAVEAAGRGVAAWVAAETGGEATVALPQGFKGVED